MRERYSRPIYDKIHWLLTLWKNRRQFLPSSGMGQAIDYTLNLWTELGKYLADGRLEIDQNIVENSIRPTAVGKKNWLFIGAAEAGQRSAVLYTVVESCRRQGIDPYTYLRHVLTVLPKSTNQQIKDLTPAAWAKAQKQALKQAA